MLGLRDCSFTKTEHNSAVMGGGPFSSMDDFYFCSVMSICRSRTAFVELSPNKLLYVCTVCVLMEHVNQCNSVALWCFYVQYLDGKLAEMPIVLQESFHRSNFLWTISAIKMYHIYILLFFHCYWVNHTAELWTCHGETGFRGLQILKTYWHAEQSLEQHISLIERKANG